MPVGVSRGRQERALDASRQLMRSREVGKRGTAVFLDGQWLEAGHPCGQVRREDCPFLRVMLQAFSVGGEIFQP